MQLVFTFGLGRVRSALSPYLFNSTRSYTTSHTPVRQQKKPAVYLARRTPAKREEAPSPLSPLARIPKSEFKRPSRPRIQSDTPANSSEKKRRRPEKPRVVQANAPRGLSSSRKLLVTPATPRTSRTPVWARPPTSVTKDVAKKRAPSGKSWSEHRSSLKETYPERWNPTKKISREAMQALRELNKADPETYPSWVLAQRFKISPEAARRILKSTWTMGEDRKEEKVMRERKTRIERMKRMKEEEMHQMVRAGIKLKVHPDDRLELK